MMLKRRRHWPLHLQAPVRPQPTSFTGIQTCSIQATLKSPRHADNSVTAGTGSLHESCIGCSTSTGFVLFDLNDSILSPSRLSLNEQTVFRLANSVALFEQSEIRVCKLGLVSNHMRHSASIRFQSRCVMSKSRANRSISRRPRSMCLDSQKQASVSVNPLGRVSAEPMRKKIRESFMAISTFGSGMWQSCWGARSSKTFQSRRLSVRHAHD